MSVSSFEAAGMGEGVMVQIGEFQRVLLAEDDPDQREILTEVLEYAGYRVSTAANPAEVIDRLSEQPSAVILDVFGVTSPQVLSVLRGMTPRPAVVVVSGDHKLPKIAERMGADGFVAKPYELEELFTALRQALQDRMRRLSLGGGEMAHAAP